MRWPFVFRGENMKSFLIALTFFALASANTYAREMKECKDVHQQHDREKLVRQFTDNAKTQISNLIIQKFLDGHVTVNPKMITQLPELKIVAGESFPRFQLNDVKVNVNNKEYVFSITPKRRVEKEGCWNTQHQLISDCVAVTVGGFDGYSKYDSVGQPTEISCVDQAGAVRSDGNWVSPIGDADIYIISNAVSGNTLGSVKVEPVIAETIIPAK
jgi:hypothetical protein